MTQGRYGNEVAADRGKDKDVVDHETKIDAETVGEAGQGTETVEAAEIIEMTDEGTSFCKIHCK